VLYKSIIIIIMNLSKVWDGSDVDGGHHWEENVLLKSVSAFP